MGRIPFIILKLFVFSIFYKSYSKPIKCEIKENTQYYYNMSDIYIFLGVFCWGISKNIVSLAIFILAVTNFSFLYRFFKTKIIWWVLITPGTLFKSVLLLDATEWVPYAVALAFHSINREQYLRFRLGPSLGK